MGICGGSESGLAQAWYDKGRAGGGQVKGKPVTAKQCFQNGLEADPNPLLAVKLWTALAAAGGGTVNERECNAKECYEQILTLDRANQSAWRNLAFAGGGKVADQKYSKVGCFGRALQLEPSDKVSWCALGIEGGGAVGNETYSNKDCMERLLDLDPSQAHAWCHLGNIGGGEVDDAAHTEKQCYERALALDPTHQLSWENLGRCLQKGEHGVVLDKEYSKRDCRELSEIGADARHWGMFCEHCKRDNFWGNNYCFQLQNYCQRCWDKSGNGYERQLQGMTTLCATREEAIDFMFCTMDKDKDGEISISELKAAFQQRVEAASEQDGTKLDRIMGECVCVLCCTGRANSVFCRSDREVRRC